MTQAHRHHQRRRPDAAQHAGDQPARRQQDHRDRGADRRARQRPRRDRRDAEPREPDQGAVLQRHQPQGAAADLPEGGADDLAPLDLRAETPWAPKVNYPISEPVMRLPEPLPPISGLVLTSLKENELVEIPIVSPLPAGQINPVLAHWTYGLGRSVAFTSDAGRRWAKSWPDWQSYSAFWSQVVRWSMRPADRGNLTLNVRREQGRIKVVIDALDKENQFLNFLQHPGQRRQPRPEAVVDRAGADRAGALRGDGRERRGQRQLLRQPRLSRPGQRPGDDLLGRLGPVLGRVSRAAVATPRRSRPWRP